MKIGFIGTGVISEAVITGMMKSGIAERLGVEEIVVSTRSQAISTALSERYEMVRVVNDNQTIVDQSDLLFLAVLPQVAQQVLSQLAFRPDQEICSLIATLPVEKITAWGGEVALITRAVPLPPVAELAGITVLSGQSERMEAIFEALGGVIVTQSLQEFDAYTVPGSMMGTYFGFQDIVASWIVAQGGTETEARSFLANVFAALARTAEGSDLSFAALREGHSTPGGLNEQMFRVFCEEGGRDAIVTAMDTVAERITKARS
ncbi:pyrroline-5-carboxylate reductase [Celeribacter neptunius]|uniref:Pyrroline-5-carboxylate reductase n=1 Tax=Celeribacter neptunius TaxID=588602 RepID=A0A1I3NJZ3_9RHOB|nr:pyrroline-5-carboxylate reductase [Celeribacter neptunius]SFJ09056.1 pyrroline-5-carboxylate reductase [Celeribacter neptunius]